MMPVPAHLKGLVVPDDSSVDESQLSGRLRCTCGCEEFRLLYPGQTHESKGKAPCMAEFDGKYFFLVKAACVRCGSQHLLIDKDFHGWNGMVCHDPEQAALPRPKLVEWKCLSCGAAVHKASVEVRSEGRADFMEETDGEFDPELWPDAFGDLSMDIACSHCGKSTKTWIDVETM